MTTPNKEQTPSVAPFTMPNSLKVLTDTIEEYKVFRREQGDRLKQFMQQLRLLHTRLENSEAENRRLKAQVQSLESDNKRLNRENDVLLRTQQTMDSAIHLACGTFHETAQYVADATRMSMPTITGSFDSDIQAPSQQPPELTLVKRQPISTAKAPLDIGLEPRRDIKPLSPYQAPEAQVSPVAAEIADIDSVEAMTAEIDRMLANEFSELPIAGDDIGATAGEAAAADKDAGDEAAKAA